MNFSVRFTLEAIQTFNALIDQLRQRWGDGFVDKFANKVASSLSIVESSPYAFPLYNESAELRKCVLHKNCSMLYRVIDTEIVIICFWDNRQEPLFDH